MSNHTHIPWHLMFTGVASTPDYTIRAGETFKEALTGPLICSFPETTSRTQEEVTANAKLVAAAPAMLHAFRLYRQAYGKLHDMLSDCIESGRLTAADLPDDYHALVEQLAGPCTAAEVMALKVLVTHERRKP